MVARFVNISENYGIAPGTRKGALILPRSVLHYIFGRAEPKM